MGDSKKPAPKDSGWNFGDLISAPILIVPAGVTVAIILKMGSYNPGPLTVGGYLGNMMSAFGFLGAVAFLVLVRMATSRVDKDRQPIAKIYLSIGLAFLAIVIAMFWR